MKTIEALTTFGGHDAGRNGKLVSMQKGTVQEVSDEFAADVVRAGHAALASKPKKKVKVTHGAG